MPDPRANQQPHQATARGSTAPCAPSSFRPCRSPGAPAADGPADPGAHRPDRRVRGRIGAGPQRKPRIGEQLPDAGSVGTRPLLPNFPNLPLAHPWIAPAGQSPGPVESSPSVLSLREIHTPSDTCRAARHLGGKVDHDPRPQRHPAESRIPTRVRNHPQPDGPRQLASRSILRRRGAPRLASRNILRRRGARRGPQCQSPCPCGSA